jgi:hypothetical protein
MTHEVSPALDFPGVTQQHLANALALVARKLGGKPISVTYIGEVASMGVKVSWTYDPDALDLSVTIERDSLFDPSLENLEADLTAFIGSTG